MPQKLPKLEIVPQSAAKHYTWFMQTGGILIWRSAIDPTESWVTPLRNHLGFKHPRPVPQAKLRPERSITSMEDVVVNIPKVVNRFGVAVRQIGDSMVLTDSSRDRLSKTFEIHKRENSSAFFDFDQENGEAVIYVVEKRIPLSEFVKLDKVQ